MSVHVSYSLGLSSIPIWAPTLVATNYTLKSGTAIVRYRTGGNVSRSDMQRMAGDVENGIHSPGGFSLGRSSAARSLEKHWDDHHFFYEFRYAKFRELMALRGFEK